LIKEGSATDDECSEAWEKIVQKNNYHSGNNKYNNYLNLVRQLNLSIKELNAVVSTILCLCFVVDDDQIKFLKSKGYKIDTSSASAYERSLAVALHESGNIRTKIKIRQAQIKNFNQKAIENKEQNEMTFDEMLSALSMEVGFQLPDTITLAQYNAYAKRVIKKQEALERAGKKQQRGNVRA
jgi:hypothetical protein